MKELCLSPADILLPDFDLVDGTRWACIACDQFTGEPSAVMGMEADPFYGAPTVILVLANRERSTWLEDGSLAMGNLQLAAHALGLGSCWIHRCYQMFESEEGKALLKEWGVEGDYAGVGCCILGYQKEEPKPRVARREGQVFYIK